MSKLFLPLVLVASVFYGIADAKCKGPIRCSQGSVTLEGEDYFVTYKDTNGGVFWDDHLLESVSTSCVVVIYNECSVQAFGKGDPYISYAEPGTCALIDGKVFCECNDAHYCNIDFNRWFKAANDLYGQMDCPHLTMHSAYKQPEQFFYGIADAKCNGPIRCSQGTKTLGSDPNFVTYKDTNGIPYWAALEESVSTSCVVVIYNECSVQAFGKGDPSLNYAAPGTCALRDGKVYCECNDAHYCNIDLNRWFAAASQLFNGQGTPMSCPSLQYDGRYKEPQQC